MQTEMLEKVERLSVAEWAFADGKQAHASSMMKKQSSIQASEFKKEKEEMQAELLMSQKENASLKQRLSQLEKESAKHTKEKQRLTSELDELR
jgi:hypothetical protein